jgi:UDPglucose--hexose-1-phosphate uridylyltransferase
MSELRFDCTTADWVVFAPLRKLRPHDGAVQPAAEGHEVQRTCPFCPGNESMTPHEIYAVRQAGAGQAEWQTRVVPNKFPALRIEEDDRRVRESQVFEHLGGCGAHEVVIETPAHTGFLASLPLVHVETVVRTLHTRYVDLLRDKRFQAIVIFKNYGERAGTSLRHPHWQIIATPVVPRLLRMKLREATEHFDRYGSCLYEVLLEEELAAQRRIVAMNSEFVAFAPYASQLPFETWIMPRRSQAGFSALVPEQIPPLAVILSDVLRKIYVGLEDPHFNLTVDTAPRGEEDEPHFRWHIRVLPRLSTAAGFELGSGMSINTVLPEDAAEFLRTESATVLNQTA